MHGRPMGAPTGEKKKKGTTVLRKQKGKNKNVGAGLVPAHSERGITLIALVITIIVLLILAGVTIAMVLRPNGIIDRAKGAKTKTEQASQNEQTDLAGLPNQMESYLTSGESGGEFGKIHRESLYSHLT